MRFVFFLVIAAGATAAENHTLVDRVGSTGFVQLEAESFRQLTPRQQALTYWLTQASIAIDPINYDQNSIYGLRQKCLLEEIVRHAGVLQADARPKIVDFTKLFWANRGNHNEMTAQKFLPEFTFDELKAAARATLAAGGFRAGRYGAPPSATRPIWIANWRRCGRRCSTPNFQPMITAKSPQGQARHPAGQRQQLLFTTSAWRTWRTFTTPTR